MKQKNTISILVICIALLASVAASTGIFSDKVTGPFEFRSIHGKTIQIYGRGVYHNMSSDVAVQGIGQDYVTLFIGIPLLLLSLILANKGSLRGRFILAGVLNYFLVTYLFYLEIAIYNQLFLVYVLLISTSFFAFLLVLFSFDTNSLTQVFKKSTPVKLAGGFLIFNSIMIALLWLSVIVPPIIDGTIIPEAVQHYTTLTVQGLDLGIFLPSCFVAGYLLIKKNRFGYLFGTVTLVFLPLLMTALLAKLIAMGLTGVSVVPAIFLIPVITLISYFCCFLLLKNIVKQ